MKGLLTLEILDYWHAGSGEGEGRRIDETVVRTRAGLPYVPGRTLKGLLRSACRLAEDLGHVEPDMTERLFGSPLGPSRFETASGAFAVSSATLPDEWERFAATSEGGIYAEGMFELLSNTAIDASGQVIDHTLRTFEYAIPLTLEATFSLEPTDDLSPLQEALKTATTLVRALGSSRTRGFGRVDMSLSFEDGDRA